MRYKVVVEDTYTARIVVEVDAANEEEALELGYKAALEEDADLSNANYEMSEAVEAIKCATQPDEEVDIDE